ncbi:cupin domain-containing protein [Salinicola endophyticus]|uniref:Cupin domain-containing protein n=1 Tax=Salinicola endophyticus TaxID=1949083 RepID=A0AB74UA13_9GAMM
MSAPSPDTRRFDSDQAHGMPNSALPLLIYRQVISAASAEASEALFARHGWVPEWRYGLYPFDHFHSTAHEALGVFRGQAVARLGGPQGERFPLAAGDVLILPAGVAHACVSADDDFCMVGAYPPGQRWAVERGDPAQFAAACARVAAVPLPPADPVGGELLAHWQRV